MFDHVYCLCLKGSSWVGFPYCKNKQCLIILEEEAKKKEELKKKKKAKTKPRRASQLGLEAVGFAQPR